MSGVIKANQRGYDGFSMSDRAVTAYKNGERPISKWTSKDAKAFNALLASLDIDITLTLKEFKVLLNRFGYTSWHHTSKYANRTDLFSPTAMLFSYEFFSTDEDTNPIYPDTCDIDVTELPAEEIEYARTSANAWITLGYINKN